MNIPNLPEALIFKDIAIDYSDDFVKSRVKEGIVFPNCLDRAVLKRQCEYLAGRACVYRGLMALTQKATRPIGTGELGQPLWPEGLIGSISHCDHHAVAMVGNQSHHCLSVGVDIEQEIEGELAQNIARQVLSKSEEILGLSAFKFQHLITLIFSAKESIYKAIFPFVNQVLDFDSVELVHINTDSGELTFNLCPSLKWVFHAPIVVHYYRKNERLFITWCCLSKKNVV